MNHTLTVNEITRWGPCDREPGEKYSREGLRKLFGGETISVQGIADLDIPAEDKLWVWLRPEVIPERDLHLLACLFAEHVQPPDADARSLEAIRVKRAWVRGQATDEELDAAWAAARAATGAAAWAAAWAAAGDAAGYAARGAERAWQVALVLRYLRGEVDLANNSS